MDDNGHGTFVAGVIGAVTNNAMGIAGIAQSVSLIACKFLDATGNGQLSDAIKCFEYCISKGAHVISNSWGRSDTSPALLVSFSVKDPSLLPVNITLPLPEAPSQPPSCCRGGGWRNLGNNGTQLELLDGSDG